MAITKTPRKVQVIIGTGNPVAGDVANGGIYINFSAGGDFQGLWSSRDGLTVKELITVNQATMDIINAKLDATAQAADSALLGGQTPAQLQATIVASIVNGASNAYDTLLELEQAILSNDTDLSTILSNQANKVDKIAGSSLVTDAEILKLSNLGSQRNTVRATGATDNSLVGETGIRQAIEEATAYIYEY